jgi:predicted nucleic acid-binding protein
LTTSALIDTSVLIARESGRALNAELFPDELKVSVITIAELTAGVHAAATTDIRARRLATLESISSLEPLPVDAAAAREWARLRYRLTEAGRRLNVNYLWIASIALAHGMPVLTQDDDFDVLADLGGPEVIRV